MTEYSVMCEKALKFLSNNIKSYKQPENLLKWCELAKNEVGYEKSARAFEQVITKRLDRIQDFKRFTLIEKVRLVFLFSRPVCKAFVNELEVQKCIVVLSENKRITYFSSPDASCVFESYHITQQKYFKGKPVHKKKKTAVKPARKSQNVRKPKAAPPRQVIPNPQEVDDVEMGDEEDEGAPEQQPEVFDSFRDHDVNEEQYLIQYLKPEEDVDLINQYLYQEPPFNGRINYDDLDNGEHPEFIVPAEYQAPIQHNKRHQDSSQENAKRRKIDKPTELFNPPEFNGVELGKEGDEMAPEPKPEEFDGLIPTVSNGVNIQDQDDEARDQENNQAQNSIQNLEPEERGNVLAVNTHSEPPYNSPINSDNLDDGEHPELMVPNENQLPNPIQQNAKRSTVADVLNAQNQDVQARDQENNQALGQSNQSNVESERVVDAVEEAEEVIILDEKPEMPVPGTISLRKLVEQIETIAFNINLDGGFRQKTVRAVCLFKTRHQTTSIQNFNQLFNVFLSSLKVEKIQNPTGNSIKLVRLFEHFKRSLIRPLGEHLMADARKLLEEEIKMLEGSEEEIPLKSVQGKIDGLMHLITSSWTNLDE
ncbi:hypothetical protein B9Z55_027823 [Caenorhabditis nigoni]|uniref:SPK domain-containing protein n=1 Tax=Caenorhabditis nigoni TaxID=1611254 RepID=A0A2G5SEG3_9PELO|nr:hypothetical protein B9Z55_027823 [Caenorhabditis nigoni]